MTRISTVEDVIAHLKTMPPNSPVYFDCPYCGKANSFNRVGVAVMVTTQEPK
jgi:hypothetical protein